LPIITENNRRAILDGTAAKVIKLNGICHAVNAVSDHVHMVVTVLPTVALSRFIGEVKGNVSHLASRLRKDGVLEPFEWQDEYGVLSVSESHLTYVVNYVLNQQKHHAEGTLDIRLERCEI
jgi:putative transposase